MTKENTDYPPVRFPRKLRDDLQEAANQLAQDRGKERMSIADLVAEMYVAWQHQHEPAEKL